MTYMAGIWQLMCARIVEFLSVLEMMEVTPSALTVLLIVDYNLFADEQQLGGAFLSYMYRLLRFVKMKGHSNRWRITH